MTSVVDTSVKHFHSGMVNAPVLTGSAGSLISVLDSCLKDGFDLKPASSLIISSGVATLSFTGTHSATVDSVILVSGSSLPALNGEQRITAVGMGFVKFATAQANGTATGSITFKMAPLGWLKPFAGTNLAAYKSADVASTGCFLRVNDSNATTARVVGYENMTAISAGTGTFPTNVQMSGGGYWTKASIASSALIGWAIVGDGRMFYLHVSPYQAYGVGYEEYTPGSIRGFGDLISLRLAGDAYSCALGFNSQADPNSGYRDGVFDSFNGLEAVAMPRGYEGTGTAVRTASIGYSGSLTAQSGQDGAMGPFPSVVDSALRLSARFAAISAANLTPRCNVPGIYTSPQSGVAASFAHRQVTSGYGFIAGRSLLALSVAPGISTHKLGGISFIDITGPWR